MRCPVDWIEDPDSRVEVMATAVEDLKGIARLLKGFGTGEIPVRAIGAQFGTLRRRTPVAAEPDCAVRGDRSSQHPARICCSSLPCAPIGAQGANLAALLLTAIANTAANRRFTFGVRGGERRPASVRGTGRLRHRPGVDQRRTGGTEQLR